MYLEITFAYITYFMHAHNINKKHNLINSTTYFFKSFSISPMTPRRKLEASTNKHLKNV